MSDTILLDYHNAVIVKYNEIISNYTERVVRLEKIIQLQNEIRDIEGTEIKNLQILATNLRDRLVYLYRDAPLIGDPNIDVSGFQLAWEK